MLKKITNHPKIFSLFSSHARELISLLKSEGLHFSIICNTSLIEFDPPLTQKLHERLGKMSVFILSGYSFQSLEVSRDFFTFEAGLIIDEGNDIATFLKVPYSGVVQILAQDENSSTPLFINLFEAKNFKKQGDSRQAILAKNQILLKRKK